MNALGRFFACCSDEEQAEFLNTAGRNLRRFCQGSDDMQLSRIVDHLDFDGRRLVKALAEFVKVDEDTPHVVKRIIYQEEVVPSPSPEANGDPTP